MRHVARSALLHLFYLSAVGLAAAPRVLHAQHDSSAAAARDSATLRGDVDAEVARADSAVMQTALEAQSAEAARAAKTLRVCADPDNLPFSNAARQGFENRIAELIAKERGETVAYTWWPQRRGFVRNTLRARLCDLVVGVPVGYDPVLTSRPYYRSTYYIVTRADRNLNVTSLDDPELKELKIGVNMIGEDYTNTPPAHALGIRGIQVSRGYPTFYNRENRPSDIIDGVVNGEIDVAIAWGPLAGYFAKKSKVPLTLTPLPDADRTGFPFAFNVGLGVRRADKEFRAELEEVLGRERPEIERILKEYNVPTMPVTAAAEADEDDDDDDKGPR